MRIRRDISSVPLRTASETWDRFVELVSGPGALYIGELKAAGRVIATSIADEILAERPLLLEGVGPQLRVYCRYGADAIQEGTGVDALTWTPTAGEWTLHVPCDAENLAWVRAAVAKTPRIKVFDAAEADRFEEATAADSAPLEVDWNLKD
ncbi:MAG TPA: hypothetical protein VMB83_12595 [Roseiarcus sp.]|nr:hypothetical protein [Roseiarcus sp.]